MSMKILTKSLVVALMLLLVAGCTTTQRLDSAVLAAELSYLDSSYERASATLEENLHLLEETDRETVQVAWQQLTNVRDLLHSLTPEDAAASAADVEHIYYESKIAYLELRDVVAKHADNLSAQDRMFVRRVDTSAQRLDRSIDRLLAEGGDDVQVWMDSIRLSTQMMQLVTRLL